MVNKKLVSKKLVAILLAVVLVIGTLPVGFASVFAAIKNKYVISIADYNYSGTVTLTDKNNAENKFTQEMKKGEAKFDNLDDETAYDLKITKLYGFGDYHNDNFVPSDTSFTLSNTDLTAVNTVKVSGRIVDESDKPVENLGFTYSPVGFTDISFDGNTDDNGKYSFDVYKDVEYSVEFNVDKQYNEVKKTVNASHDENFGDEKLSLKQFGISAKVTAAGGKITGDNTMVDYGKDLQKDTIVAKADTNYVIKTLTVDGNEIDDAKGLEIYDLSKVDALKNVTENHFVSVSFYRPTYEITINYNKNGTVKDNSDNHLVTSGGKIILKQGDVAGFTAVAETNYHIAKVKIDGKSVDDVDFNNATTKYSKTFDDNKAHSVTITFAINTFNVTVNSGENGTAKASPATVDYNGSTVITITPDKGYDIDTVKVNGSVVDNLTETENVYKYTISKITSDVTVEANFKEIEKVDVDDVLKNDYCTISFSETPVVIGNKYIVGKGGSVTITPVDPYYRVKVNGELPKSTITYNKTKVINDIQISTNKFVGGWDKTYSAKIEFVVDENAPTIANITKTPDQEYYNKAYNVSFYVSDNIAGVDSVYYGTENDITKAKNATFDSASGKASFTTTDGEFNGNYYIWAKDKVGNPSSISVKINIDKTNPTIDEFKFEAPTLNACKHGTYASEDITVTITASDKNSNVTNSGVKEITFNGETQKVKGDGSAIFTLKASDFASAKEVSATATDFAGNTSQITIPTSDNSNVKSNLVTITSDEADVNISRNETAKYIDGDKYWYADDTDFKVNISDKSGIKKVIIKMNDKIVVDDTLDGDIEAVKSKEYTVNTSKNAVDGENVITVDVVNVANNASATKTLSIYKDTKAPTVDNFEFEVENNSTFKKMLHFLTFGNFFNEKVKITVKGNDEKASSAIKNVTLYGDEKEIATQEYVDGVATFEVPAEAITDETLHLNKTI